MPTYPFQRAKPIGWSVTEKLTSAELNQIDANAAQAADGLIWTDVAQIQNWSTPQVIDASGTPGLAYVWSSYEQAWWAFGTAPGGVPTGYKLRGRTGATWLGTGGIVSGSGNLTPQRNAVDFDPVSNVLLFGGLPSVSSANKFRRYDSLTATWTAPASSQTSTASVNCCKWVPPLGLWIAGHSNGPIETSPDGVSWTSRSTGANSSSRWSIAYNPTGTVVMACNVNGNQIMQSTDGVTWNIRTLPSTSTWQSVVYVPQRGEFVLLNQDLSQVAFSTDGITWAARARTLPPITLSPHTAMNAVAFGRNVATVVWENSGTVQMAVLYSQDGGATWKNAACFGVAVKGPIASSGQQLIYTTDGNLVTSCLAGGF